MFLSRRFISNLLKPCNITSKVEGFDGLLSGQSFSAIHGDLVTKIFNGQTKCYARMCNNCPNL